MSCPRCNDTRLQLGGWMGPTREAPFPRPCPDCSPGLTPREIQVAQTEWFLDNADRQDVQQILARKAVMDAAAYGLVVVADYALRPAHVDSAVYVKADLVIGNNNHVLKDRYGTQGYKLSATEVHRIAADCGEFRRVHR